MIPVRILDDNLNLLTEIDDYESFQFIRRWHSIGEFELHINRNKQNTRYLQKNNFILLGSDLNKIGIIKYRNIPLDENGKISEQMVIKGFAAKGILGQRITYPPTGQAYDSITSNIESIMRHYVDANVVDTVDASRKISLVTMATNQGRGGNFSFQSRLKNLADELEALSLYSGLGWDLVMDSVTKKLVFDVYQGRNLTAGQSTLPPVIFSPYFDSIKAMQFTDSDLNYRNVGYIGGQGDGDARDIITIGTSTGLNRLETFIDARDVADSGTPLKDRGLQKMAELDTELFLDGQILPYSRFVYEQDWDLGDIVTIQNKDWNLTADERITEVKETYEFSQGSPNFIVDATFGKAKPTLYSKLKQRFSQLDNELRR